MKLTNEKRDNIINAVVLKMFESDHQKMKEKRNELAELVISQVIDFERLAKSLPGDLPEFNQLQVLLPGNSQFYSSFTVNRRCPFALLYFDNYVRFSSDRLTTELEGRLCNFLYEERDLSTLVKQTKAEVNSLVYSVNTTNQLREVWPELFDIILIEDDTKKPSNQLAPLVSKFNGLLKKAS